MDTPGRPEEPPRPAERVPNPHVLSQGPEGDEELRPADHLDNMFAAIQLSEWGHPKQADQDMVALILDAASTDPFVPSDESDAYETWDQHLARLVQQDHYVYATFDRTDPFYVPIIDALVLAKTDNQRDAIEIVRRLHIITQYNELDPIELSAHVSTILGRILASNA